ncbi:MFS transporter [Mycolicibacterium fluoranthenivorans]|uniref:MFS transporter n=1 Tax=Mycolicibacterium fluoranthenivorans TaxID=258505 RepID=A0A7G8PCG7_9MYCO|nr:MFS transporter [Mycolicibacterium fluoranthenivorans]QNJ92033.1 MFS transporter [Mycolicibacterium fluoranthenivorans]
MPEILTEQRVRPANPWHALWAMLVGFFMILVDSTIVAVANKRVMEALSTDYDGVIWVTSAYLLAYAVPLLVAGRLGDRFGPKNLYLLGLGVFTLASLWCGLSGSIEMLIAARVVQGIGAALLTPQTLSTITRIFPPDRRGVAMSVWGATAGVATLVGPLAGGVLVDGLGWQWIFFVNVPIGVLGLGLAVWLVPALPTKKHSFDLLGVALSGIAMFLIVFGLQEGQSHHWAPWIWATIVAGTGFMAAFVYWQAVNPREPLIPLTIFRDRDFTLSNVGIAVIGFTVTAMILPVMFYAPAVCGLSYTRSALLTAPMAIATGVLAPVVGRIVDRAHPAPIIGFGFAAMAIGLTWLSIELTPSTPIWRLLLPLTVMGAGMAFIWSPLAATATRNLPPQLAGAGSGVYNTTRQVGSVLGSAGMAAFMTSRIGAEMPAGGAAPAGAEGQATALPDFLREPFSAALSQSLLLPAFVALFGVVAALFLRGSVGAPRLVTGLPAPRLPAPPPQHSVDEHWHDEDDYIEYTVDWAEPAARSTGADAPTDLLPVVDGMADESMTEPLYAHVEHPLPAPADTWHAGPVDTWQHVEPEPEPEPEPDRAWRSILDGLLEDRPVDQIAHPHNGFHADEGGWLQPLPPSDDQAEAPSEGRHSRPSRGRHSRDE